MRTPKELNVYGSERRMRGSVPEGIWCHCNLSESRGDGPRPRPAQSHNSLTQGLAKLHGMSVRVPVENRGYSHTGYIEGNLIETIYKGWAMCRETTGFGLGD